MKQIAMVLLLFLLIPLFSMKASAEQPITLFLNGEELQTADQAVVVHTTIYVPLSIIKSITNASTTWDNVHKKLTIHQGNLQIEMTVGTEAAFVNSKKVPTRDAALLLEDKATVPLRFISAQLGMKVTWDALTKSVYIFKPSTGKNIHTTAPKPISTSSVKPVIPEEISVSGHTSSSLPAFSADEETIHPDRLAYLRSIEFSGNQIVIQADKEVKPEAFYLKDPDRIVLDVPNATFAQTFNGSEPQLSGEITTPQLPSVNKIRYAHFSNDPSTIRFVIDLNQSVQYSVSVDEKTNQIMVNLKSAQYKIVIDAGHGGKDPGAMSISNNYEKWLTLSLATKVNALLAKEPSIQTYMTREDDTFIELDDRVKAANEMNADLFISIHANRFTSPSVRGVETYFSRDESIPLAEKLHQAVLQGSGLPDRGVRRSDFRVIKYTTMPAVLLETGYLSNVNDESKLMTEEVQDRIAQQLVEAIKQYLQVQ